MREAECRAAAALPSSSIDRLRADAAMAVASRGCRTPQHENTSASPSHHA